jgi:hypothetical protein
MRRALFAIALLACDPAPRTQVMVIIDADAQLRAEIADVSAVVEGGPSRTTLAQVSEETIAVRHWPLQLPIVPQDDDASRFFRVEVTGFDGAGTRLVVARAISSFVEEETRALVIRLERSCNGRFDCAIDETCQRGSCTNAFVSPDDLPLLGTDAGTSDGGRDGGRDAGPPPGDAGRDAGMIDAGADAGIDDAGFDAGMIDAGVDAGRIDAGPLPCLAPNVICGTACVDLATDEQNCGVCGYAVVGARTCVGGKPTPPWLPVESASTPNVDAWRIVWTGRELLLVSDPRSGSAGEVHAFDPATSTWRDVGTPLGGLTQTPPLYVVGLPDRNAALLMQNTGAFLWEHDTGAGAWRPLTPAPLTLTSPASAPIEGDLTAYTGRYVFLFDDDEIGRGIRFDLTDETWATVATNTLCSFSPWTREWGAFSTAYVGGSVVLLTSSDSRTTDPATLCPYSVQNAAILDPDTRSWTYTTINRNNALMVGWVGNASLLPLGGSLYLAGGPRFNYCGSGGTLERDAPVVWTPGTGTTSAVGYPGMPASSAFTAYTGRALLSYGGAAMPAACNQAPLSVSNALGVGTFDGSTISWRAGPASGIGLRALEAQNSAQSLWTGRELFVVNGMLWSSTGGTRPRGGARYQPPVGCVCPRDPASTPSVADGCTGVAPPEAPYDACVP